MACCGDKLRAAAGRLVAAVGLKRADPATVESRRAICRKCDRATRASDGVRVVRCRECTCFIRPKTALADRRCPLGKW